MTSLEMCPDFKNKHQNKGPENQWDLTLTDL